MSLDRRTRLTLFPSVPSLFGHLVDYRLVLRHVRVPKGRESERTAKKALTNFDVKK